MLQVCVIACGWQAIDSCSSPHRSVPTDPTECSSNPIAYHPFARCCAASRLGRSRWRISYTTLWEGRHMWRATHLEAMSQSHLHPHTQIWYELPQVT